MYPPRSNTTVLILAFLAFSAISFPTAAAASRLLFLILSSKEEELTNVTPLVSSIICAYIAELLLNTHIRRKEGKKAA